MANVMLYILFYCNRIKKNAIVFKFFDVTHIITKITIFNHNRAYIIRYRRFFRIIDFLFQFSDELKVNFTDKVLFLECVYICYNI